MATFRTRIARPRRGVIVAAEAVLAAVAGGILVGGYPGWLIAVSGVLVGLVLVAFAVRGRVGFADPAQAEIDPDTELRVLRVSSRSSGEVGVLGDPQGIAAGLELAVRDGVGIDLDAVSKLVANDPSRPSALQLRVTGYAPPPPSQAAFARPSGSYAPVLHRRVHVLLRLEPVWASDVVRSHGGGAEGSRAALVAAVDRLAAWLRRHGIPNRTLDPDALNALLREDTSTDLVTASIAADPVSTHDLARLLDRLDRCGATRTVLSVCADLTVSDHWRTFAVLNLACTEPARLRPACRKILADPAALGVAPASALSAVLPLGGGPGDLTSALTLARS